MTRPNSAEIHHLHGNPSNLPAGERDVKPPPLAPLAPNWLSKRGRANWQFLAPELERNALLTKRDQVSFGLMCEDAAMAQTAMLKMRGSSNNYDHILENDPGHSNRLRRHPAFIIYQQASKSYMAWAKEFGLTASSRIGLLLGGTGAPALHDDGDDEDEAVFA